MTSPRFRRQLRQEAQDWQDRGLISAQQYQQLDQQYQLSQLEAIARNTFSFTLLALGASLLALAIATLVAANWQEIAPWNRLIILLGVMLGSSTAGFALWRSGPLPPAQPKQRRTGEALLLLGSFSLGPCLAQLSQNFHISGPDFVLPLLWALGALAMAYSLRLTSIGILAALLLHFSLWRGHQNYPASDLLLYRMIENFSWLALLLLWPVAYRCRSQILFIFGAVGSVLALQTSQISQGSFTGWLVALKTILPGLVFWWHADRPWNLLAGWQRAALAPVNFQALGRRLGVMYLAAILYFQGSGAGWLDWGAYPKPEQLPGVPEVTPDVWGSLLGLGAIALIHLALHGVAWSKAPRISLSSGVMLAMLVLVSGAMGFHRAIAPIGFWGPTLCNILLAVLALGCLRASIESGDRAPFWYGLVVLTLQILTRTLEWNGDLVFKALVFGLCGVGVILAGLWFERYSQRVSTRRSLNQSA
jgi:uncharacterized membrane protein